jgi:hypothetical protein
LRGELGNIGIVAGVMMRAMTSLNVARWVTSLKLARNDRQCVADDTDHERNTGDASGSNTAIRKFRLDRRDRRIDQPGLLALGSASAVTALIRQPN